MRYRAAHAGDYAAWDALHGELGTGDPSPDEAHWLAELAPRLVIAEREDGGTVAYALLQELDGIGYLRQIVVAPVERGRGVARAFMAHLADVLRGHGIREWCLNVRPDNLPAMRLYTRMGMQLAYRSAAVRFRWTIVDALPPAPAGVGAELVPAARDEALERRFALVRGVLAEGRARGRVLMALAEGGAPAGVALFDPSFPGAFPFKVARPELAGALLGALRPYALPDKPEAQVVCEDDDALVAALLAAGAWLKLDFAHMRGTL